MRKKLFFRNLLILMLLISLPTLTVAQLGLRYTENVIREKEARTARAELDFFEPIHGFLSAIMQRRGHSGGKRHRAAGLAARHERRPADRLCRASHVSAVEPNGGPAHHGWRILGISLYLDGADMVLSTDGLRQLKTMQDDSWLSIYRAHQDWFGLSSFLTYAREDAYGNQVVSCLLPLLNAQGTCSGVFVVWIFVLFVLKSQRIRMSVSLRIWTEILFLLKNQSAVSHAMGN